ncbi:MAG: PA14 domain-containing protein [Bacteroidota bacterium]
MKKLALALLTGLCLAFGMNTVSPAQVLDPNDPIVEYDSDNPPVKPPWGTLAKWVRTDRLGWNTDSYKSYFYKSMSFRLKWPANYDPSGNTDYPIIIMLHGRGERGTIYDNEWSMKHGGQKHRDAVDQGRFNGFVMYPQNQDGFWGDGHYSIIDDLIHNYLKDIHVDINRVTVHGLSAGGAGTWNIIRAYPKNFASAVPMSAASLSTIAEIPRIKHIPIWLSQGAKDRSPAPATTQQLVDALENASANLRYSFYLNLGHGVWNTHYNESDFFPFLSRANKTNPVVLDGEMVLVQETSSKQVFELLTRNEICPGDPINVRLGLTAGFDGYEWRKDGVVISGANANEYVATEFGTYEARIRRGSEWSYWSPVGVEIREKEITNTPDIAVAGLASHVIPALDGSNAVNLELPAGFIEYEWRLAGTTQVLSTDRVFSVSQPGKYEATVKEQFGCASNPSSPFSVVNANGPNAPEAPIGVAAFAPSKTEIQLVWSDNPNAAYNETGFEVYRSETESGPYTFIGTTGADVLSYLDEGLIANTTYYYVLRAINATGASASTAEVSTTTQVDGLAPTAPANLRVVRSSSTSINLEWDASTDDVGVYKYDVYKDGFKSVVTDETSAEVFSLTEEGVFNFYVIARDLTGNESPASNQVTAAAVNSGLTYRYYEGDWSLLPDFNALTPIKSGQVDNINLDLRETDNRFAFYWEGFINIPVAGNYTFETRSDDGSKLYIGDYDEADLVVNNDGLHGSRYRSGTYNFPAPGAYPIVVTFFERTGGQRMEVYWSNTAHGVGSRQRIPNSAFVSDFEFPGSAPASPTNLTATATSYDAIDLTWDDNSDNENNFQIYRSTNISGPFAPIQLVGADATSYTDAGLASETTYYYQVIALGDYGESGEVAAAQEEIGNIRFGIAAQDGAGGTGYIMFTKERTHDRFTSPRPNGSNSDHFIAIKYLNDQWVYDNNSTYTAFTPESTDLIMAEVDFANDQITGLEATSGEVNGIETGFASGDLTFYADRWNGNNNDGEFTITGTYFNRNVLNGADATTLALPPSPNAPANLTATALSTTSIQIDWEDSSDNEDRFEIYRSSVTNSNFIILDTINAANGGTLSYTDEGLFTNVVYYYKIAAVNVAGATESVEASAKTLNNEPVLDPIGDFTVRFDTSFDLQLYAEDQDQELLTYSVDTLYSFATLEDYGDGTGLLQFSPAEGDTGVYEMTVSISDENGGVDSETIVVTVNDNFPPSLDPVADITVDENAASNVVITAQDPDGTSTLTWEAQGLPAFATLTPNLDGTAALSLAPDYTDAGSYPVNLTITDVDGASAQQAFNIIVNDVNPNVQIFANIKELTDAPAPWNNIASSPFASLLDSEGNDSGVALEFQTSWWRAFREGAVTGDNSGVFPDDVIKDYYFFGIFGGPNSVTVKVSGLDPAKAYNFSILASSSWGQVADNGHTIFTINGNSIPLHVQNNSQNTADFNGITPDANGDVFITMAKDTDAAVGYFNGMSISSIYDFGSAPAAPKQLTASLTEDAEVKLDWWDAPFNEEGFDVYRADTENGTYTKINATALAANSTTFTDNTVTDGSTYFYKVVAFNQFGSSVDSNIVSETVPNRAPSISFQGSTNIFINQLSVIQVEAQDPPLNQVTLNPVSLPVFASFADNGDGTGTISMNPTTDDIGTYTIEIEATDNLGAAQSESIDVTVSQEILYAVHINFSNAQNEGAPWNNTAKVPAANDVFSNLNDNTGANSGISLTLNTAFGGIYNAGAQTGDNSGIVPDRVLREYYWFGTFGAPNTAQITVSGLDITKSYNFKFVGSSVFSGSGITDNGHTVYKIGNQSASVHVQNNTSEFGVIGNVSPNASGEIVIDIQKGNTATVGYINALIIEAVEATQEAADPDGLTAVGVSENSIQLSWNDNASEEEQYYIYRSNTANDTDFVLVDSVGQDVNSYMDNGLSAGTIYYYKVQAELPTTLSGFSNTASGGTVAFSIYVNINGDPIYDAPTPWNNLSRTPDTGDVFVGFSNSLGIPTGMRIFTEQGMQGSNDWGTSTGDDSGIYPDLVMQSFFFNDAFDPAGQYRIQGLEQGFRYNFTFFGAIQTGFSIFTNFTIGDETVTNSQSNNISEAVSINGVVPNQNNEVLVQVQEASGSRWAIFNAMVVDAFPVDPNGGVTSRANNGITDAGIYGNVREVRQGISNPITTLYPNPATSNLNVRVTDASLGDIQFTIVDLMGKVAYQGTFSNDQVNNEFQINLDELGLNNGVYIMKAVFADTQTFTYRIIKE